MTDEPTAAAPPTPFELCTVCNINHNQGRRHRYSTSHRGALAGVLSRFHSKLADLRFFLRHPARLRPEDSSLNRLWCVFCAADLRELGSAFACGNAIEHLASAEHLKKLKEFLWRHGGGMDRVEAFRVSEADFLKWEKGCDALKNVDSSPREGKIGPQPGPSKDIQNELTSNHADSFQKFSVSSFSSSVPYDVIPLQSPTYEDYSRCHTEVSGSESTRPSRNAANSLSVTVHESLSGGQTKQIGSSQKRLSGSYLSNGKDPRTAFGDHRKTENLHTGAPPPWLDTSQENNKEITIKGLPQTSRSKKLNPKRVGAAWSERRRIELEMEKRGELVASSCDANWLPNFGRVWQSGTRKESRKEFEKEKPKLLEAENSSQATLQLQPYISKRMRMSDANNYGAVNGYVEDLNTLHQQNSSSNVTNDPF